MDTDALMHSMDRSLHALGALAARTSHHLRLLIAGCLCLLALSLLASTVLVWQPLEVRREALAVQKLMLQSKTAVLQNTQTIEALTRTLLEQYRAPHP